jgi:hypothetical protein
VKLEANQEEVKVKMDTAINTVQGRMEAMIRPAWKRCGLPYGLVKRCGQR